MLFSVLCHTTDGKSFPIFFPEEEDDPIQYTLLEALVKMDPSTYSYQFTRIRHQDFDSTDLYTPLIPDGIYLVVNELGVDCEVYHQSQDGYEAHNDRFRMHDIYLTSPYGASMTPLKVGFRYSDAQFCLISPDLDNDWYLHDSFLHFPADSIWCSSLRACFESNPLFTETTLSRIEQAYFADFLMGEPDDEEGEDASPPYPLVMHAYSYDSDE